MPDERTAGGQRRYDLTKLRPNAVRAGPVARTTIAYARVSGYDQKEDRERQIQLWEMFCSANGRSFEILSDLGAVMDYHKRGLRNLLARIVAGDVDRLLLTHKDRLLRVGAGLVFAICKIKDSEVIINKGEEPTFEEALAPAVLGRGVIQAVGGTAGPVRPDDDLPLVRIHGELRPRGVQPRDVIGCRPGARIPGPEERAQGFPRGIERRHQRVAALAALVRGGRPRFIGMRRHQGPVDVDTIERRGPPGGPDPASGDRPRWRCARGAQATESPAIKPVRWAPSPNPRVPTWATMRSSPAWI